MAEAGDIFDPGTVVDATTATATAKVAVAVRLDEPSPEEGDYRGSGSVDFSADRLWLTDRLVTKRMDGGGGRRRIGLALVNLVVGGERELYFEGGQMWASGRRGGWNAPTGDRLSPKFTRHPLCAFSPLAHLPAGPAAALGSTIVRDAQVEAYEVFLGAAQFDGRVWEHVGAARSSLRAVVWIDSDSRIRRLSYESSFDPQEQSVLWSITEFWDFGRHIDMAALDTPPDARQT